MTPAGLLTLLLALPAVDPVAKPDGSPKAPGLDGLKLRSVGPALMSGRIVGFAVDPRDRDHFFAAAASGGVWKTTNGGSTWTPVFDDQGSYSIGCVVLDPHDPSVVWVGSGENNSQRSVGYGDGVYKSTNGGKTWENVGLKASEHIGKIVIDPRNSDTVYVAAQGPLWASGGDRGLYKTTDGGRTWKKILEISENTGVTDLVMDPRNPDLLIAAAYQRRRHVWTLINGGPESALYRSTDAGKTWTKLKTGLPNVELGRIGLASAPSDPDVVYATIEAGDKKGGVFRSVDRGATWEKRNGFDDQGQYYSHLVVDPLNKDRIYVMNVRIQVSDDGGQTLRSLGERWKHSDNHEIWIDPAHPDFYRVGCDGGIYESRDRGANWDFKSNLPITQFYDVAADESGPFYHVYGGTQDNDTLGGPARTRSVHGITNADWFVVQGGDGFHCRVDPTDPNTVYGEAQYGVLARFDRKSGQGVNIQPQPGAGEPPLRWNWDSPLVLSSHDPKRLYFAANKIFRSDDRGDTWKPISGDLTRQLDRDKLAVMGKVWGPDAVSKHVSTSYYGNIVALAESPRVAADNGAALLYAGSDDGLIQVTADGGKEWRKIDKFPGVPDRTYVSRIFASRHADATVYAAFDNHKNGDFAPYILKSGDAGATWTSIAGDLPARGSVLAFVEDPVNPDLLFVGTEFGLFVTLDGGKKWQRLKGGLPTIAVRDLTIQRQVHDLVVGTFGRGIYILDDLTPLRTLKAETLEQPVALFKPRDAVLFAPIERYGGRGKASLGASFYTADNPAYGATFTYFLKDGLKSKKKLRQEAEAAAAKKGVAAPYPTPEELRAEAEEPEPAVVLTVKDGDGNVVRTVAGSAAPGFHRATWDLRDPSVVLPRPRPARDADDDEPNESSNGPLVLAGDYSVQLAKRVGGVVTPLADPVKFTVAADGLTQVAAADRRELLEFQRKASRLRRSLVAALAAADELAGHLDQAQKALDLAPATDPKARATLAAMLKENRALLRTLRGDSFLRARNENTPTSTAERVEYAVDAVTQAYAKPTTTQREAYKIASEELEREWKRLRGLTETEWPKLEKELEEAGAPWSPGRRLTSK